MRSRSKRGLRGPGSGVTIFGGSAGSLILGLNLDKYACKADVHRVREVTQLIEDIHEADRIAARNNYSIDSRPKMLPGERRYRLKELLEKIARTGNQVKVSVDLWYPSTSGWHSGWRFWPPARGKLNNVQLLFDIQNVIDLTVTGLIRKVRRCKLCSRWYFARRKHQEFCSQGCREKDYRSTARGRGARAAYMRRYRAGLRRRDRENIKTARAK